MKCPNCGFTIKKQYKDRSRNENSYFHGVVLPILSQHLGYTPQEMKGIVKFHFGVKSTSMLTTVEFEKFMSDIRMWASDPDGCINCYIPLPNEIEWFYSMRPVKEN